MIETGDPAIRGLRDHAQRRMLHDELHARPAAPLRPPLRLTHLLMLSGEEAAASERAHVARLCRKMGAMPPGEHAVHHTVDLGDVRLRWERHTECSTYTFMAAGLGPRPFSQPAIDAVPSDWVNRLPGERLVAIQVAFTAGDAREPDAAGYLGRGQLLGSTIAGGLAAVWSDLRIRADGYARMLIRDRGIGAPEAGHQVRRLLELEGYRMLALLALPLVRHVGPRLGELEHALGRTTTDMHTQREASETEEQRYLAQLTALAAETEHLAARANYRIAASRAYYDLVHRRIELLREGRLHDLEPIGEFLERRMRPAMDTCEAVRRRIDDIAERVGRANGLLRTRIDVQRATQSRDLLDSMNRRAGMQLRLEQAVEAITVIAGAYYLSGLLERLGVAATEVVPAWSEAPVDTLVGLATPVVIGVLWLVVHRIRRRAHGSRSAS